VNRRHAILLSMLPLEAVLHGAGTKEGVEPLRILVLCTWNSCRSQMTEATLRSLDSRLEVFSAGTEPAPEVNPDAVRVMQEIGLDLSGARPKHVAQFLDAPFDYVITVCGEAEEKCPYFRGEVGRRLHMGFPDPAKATGTEEQLLVIFRESRDEIRTAFRKFYERELKPRLG
jgi:arsenate reductase (thioredoxin)